MDAPLPRVGRFRRRARTWLAALVTAIGVGAAGVSLRRLGRALPELPRAQLWTGTVSRGTFAMRVQGAGVLRPELVRWLTAESPGRVDAVLVQPGTHVTTGSALVRLENLDLQLQSDQALRDVQAAQAQALALERQQAQEQLQVSEQLSVLTNELADATRRASAYGEAAGLIVSRNDAERERDRAAALRDQVQLCREQLELLRRLGPRQLQAAQAQSAQLERVRSVRQQMLQRLAVEAPVDAVVQEVLVEPGQWVLPGAAVAKLRVSERLEAVLRIPAEQVGDVALGQRALVHTGFGRGPEHTIAGRVRRIAPAAQDSTVDVEVALEGKLPDSARADQIIDGSIEIRALPDTLFLPRPVGLPLGHSARLFRIDAASSTATRVEATIGLVSSDAVQILGGLKEGDSIILSDMSRYGAEPVLRLE